ncbi:MAG: hypothetical protein K8L97_33580 [Anaerolineae bacterium]|nr:hypothetical protein [Anaerolineae bacterium]
MVQQHTQESTTVQTTPQELGLLIRAAAEAGELEAVEKLVDDLRRQAAEAQAEQRNTERLANLTPAGKVRLEMFLEAEARPAFADRYIPYWIERIAQVVVNELLTTEIKEVLIRDSYLEDWTAQIAWAIQTAFANGMVDSVSVQQFMARFEGE